MKFTQNGIIFEQLFLFFYFYLSGLMTCSNKVDMLFWLLINSISFFAFQGSHHHRSIEIKKRRRENWRQDLLYLKRHQKTKKKEFDQLNFFALSYEVSTNKQGHSLNKNASQEFEGNNKVFSQKDSAFSNNPRITFDHGK